MNFKEHWENVYQTKSANEVSWTQNKPDTSLKFIKLAFENIGKSAKIIDVGAGDSKLVDYLLQEGYEDITILDISETAIEKAKKRLGVVLANKVTWIVSDILKFKPTTTYNVWHDRAAFHFLTTPKEIEQYVSLVNKNVSNQLIIGTFSKNGPEKCSGLNIKQYSKVIIQETFKKCFEGVVCKEEDHITPFNTIQKFIFCSLTKIKPQN